MPTFRTVVEIHHPSLGGTGTNTWHFRTASTVVGETLEATALMDMVKAFYNSCSTSRPSGTTITWDGECSGVGTSEGEYLTCPSWTHTGAVEGGPLPPHVAICVNWRGQSGDRSRRGRTFLGPVNTVSNDAAGTINDSIVGAIRTAAATLVESSDSFNNGALGVFSRQEQVFRDFVGSSVRDQFASLRSRRD